MKRHYFPFYGLAFILPNSIFSSNHQEPPLNIIQTTSYFQHHQTDSMPREDYQVPSASSGPMTSAARGSTGAVQGRATTSSVKYQCGDCGEPIELGPQALVACTSCGGRVLYKQRTKR